MYSTENKKIHYFYNGIFYTRKLNNFVTDILFEKIYGGESLLKKILKISKYSEISFSSSMINENSIKPWLNSGWVTNHGLNVCVLNLKNLKNKNINEYKNIEIKKLEREDIQYLIDLDHKIFDDYWKNSKASFEETMKSCNNNYLFKSSGENGLDGYAILGETRKFTYLQRIGIVKDYQGSGLGNNLLQSVIDFALKKKFINIKLNTQNDNVSALNLYKKNNFQVSPRKLVIMKTS
tara:strand:- start:27 stop:734 length:708 start_codon:yes stop_codon:yes gene_type:complete